MPDLSRRPARYATAAVLCGALVVSAALTSEVEWGRDSPAAAAAKVSATLREGASDVVTVASPGLGAAIAPRGSGQAAPAGPEAVASAPGRVGPGRAGTGAAASSRSAGAKSEAAKSRSTKASAAAAGKKTPSAASTVFLGGAGVRAATGTAAGAVLLGRPAATAAPYSGSEVLLAALRAPRPTVVQVAAPATAARPAPAVAAPAAPAPRPAAPAPRPATPAPRPAAPTPKPAAPQPKPVPEPAPKPTPPAGPKKDPATPVAPTPPNCGMFPYQEAAQAAYDADPVKNKALDGDGDGVACEQLRPKVAPPAPAPPRTEPQAPPQQPAPPAGPKRPKAPSRDEIVASGTYFGLATGTREESASLEYALGRQTSAESFFKGWDTGYDTDRVTAAWRDGRLPVMTWESRPLSYVEDPDEPATDYSLEAIADGTFDDYLTTYARSVTALGLPVVIRFDHEMNGDWYRWSELGRKGGPDRSADGAYAAAWKHVHDVFQGEGANNSVIWLWAPNRVDNLSAARFKPINAYYPGDDYVDWVGMSGYFRTEDVDRKQPSTFDATFATTLGQLRDVAAGKPIFLAEIGATATDPARRDDSSKVSWTQSFFDGLARQDDVAGFSWFNYAVSEDGRTNDWRLDSSQRVFDAVARGLVESGFGFEPGKDFRTRPLGTRPAPVPGPEPTPTTEPTPGPTQEPTPEPDPVPGSTPTTGPTPGPTQPSPGPSSGPPTMAPPAPEPSPEPTAATGATAPEGNRP